MQLKRHLNQYLISSNGNVSEQFNLLNINTFADAVSYIHQLAYGRNTQRDNYQLVMTEKCGTCSTKHALLKALADENGIQIDLLLGIFFMSKSNTPVVGPILDKYNIDAIPEAHCYLRYRDLYFDITFSDKVTNPTTLGIVKEVAIMPADIGQYKIMFHRDFVQNWILSKKCPFTIEEFWCIREECIEELKE